MQLWQKHLSSKLLKTFFFFLLCLFAIYVIIDLSAHGIRFFSKAGYREITLYYLNTFSSQLDLFFSLTFLLATLRVLFDLSSHREILALQMAGLSKKRLLIPFFAFAGFLSIVGFVNFQWFAPHAEEYTNDFKAAYKKKKNKEQKIYSIAFEDESELIYKSFDKDKNELSDVFWIGKADDVWHMKTLHIDSLEGTFVNHLARNHQKQFEKLESFTSKIFSEIPWNSDLVLNRFVPYESRSLSTLFLQALGRSADARIVFSHLYYKLLAPLIPFIVLITTSPLAIRYSRRTPVFLITSVSIFGLLGLKTILDGMLILGENQVLPSYIAIFAPIAIVLCFTMPQFARMR